MLNISLYTRKYMTKTMAALTFPSDFILTLWGHFSKNPGWPFLPTEALLHWEA